MTSRVCAGLTCLSAWTVLIVMCCSVVCIAGNRPSFFVVVPHATDLKQSEFEGHDQLIYRVETDYPASDVLDIIKTQLRDLGWKPMKYDWLNPDIPSSLTRGWSYFEDRTTNPPSTVWSWTANWTNEKGDVLEYLLEYRCPGNGCASTANLHTLRVIELHFPAKLADKIKRSIPKEKP